MGRHIVTLLRKMYRRKTVPSAVSSGFPRHEIDPRSSNYFSGEHGLGYRTRVHEGIVTGAGTQPDIVFRACVLRRMPRHGAFSRDYQRSSRRAGFGMKAIRIVSSFVSENTVNAYRNEALYVVNQSSKYNTYRGYLSSKIR